jgi:hypothetical protein
VFELELARIRTAELIRQAQEQRRATAALRAGRAERDEGRATAEDPRPRREDRKDEGPGRHLFGRAA